MLFNPKTKILTLPVSKIKPNPSQPRRVFSEQELISLAASIKENGLLQPVTVRKSGQDYYLIAGERRLRATQLAGITKINCILGDYTDEESAVLAVIENMQRSDLNMFEAANGVLNLIRAWDITQEQAAKRLGISQSYLANKIRLLKLSKAEQQDILQHGLSERHARALLVIKDISERQEILKKVIERGLNVSETEALIALEATPADEKKKPTRKFIAKDIRLFINTIDHAVQAMKTAGICAESERTETDDYIECTVRIPKLKRV